MHPAPILFIFGGLLLNCAAIRVPDKAHLAGNSAGCALDLNLGSYAAAPSPCASADSGVSLKAPCELVGINIDIGRLYKPECDSILDPIPGSEYSLINRALDEGKCLPSDSDCYQSDVCKVHSPNTYIAAKRGVVPFGLDTPKTPELAHMNVKWVRVDNYWVNRRAERVEKEKANLDTFDNSCSNTGVVDYCRDLNQPFYLIKKITEENIKVLLVVYDSSEFLKPNPPTEKYKDFAGNNFFNSAKYTLDAHGPIVGAWQIDNEVDIHINGRSPVPVEEYGDMLIRAYDGIRAAYSEYYENKNQPIVYPTILTSGLATKNAVYLGRLIDYLKTRREKMPFDGVALHMYATNTSQVNYYYDSVPHSVLGILNDFDDLLELKVAPNFPLWITEVGIYIDKHNPKWEGITYCCTASYLKSVYTDAAHAYNSGINLKTVFWFAWHDVEGYGQGPFGLVDGCGRPKKAAYDAFYDVGHAVHPL